MKTFNMFVEDSAALLDRVPAMNCVTLGAVVRADKRDDARTASHAAWKARSKCGLNFAALATVAIQRACDWGDGVDMESHWVY